MFVEKLVSTPRSGFEGFLIKIQAFMHFTLIVQRKEIASVASQRGNSNPRAIKEVENRGDKLRAENQMTKTAVNKQNNRIIKILAEMLCPAEQISAVRVFISVN